MPDSTHPVEPLELMAIAAYTRAVKPHLPASAFTPARSRALWVPVHYAIITAQNAAGAQGVSGGVVSTVTAGVSSFARRVVGAVSDVLTGGAAPASSPALAQAGLTPARQSTLALFLVGGVVLLSVALFSNLFGGNSK